MTENNTQSAECLSHLTAELDLCGNKAHIMRVMTSSDDMTWAMLPRFIKNVAIGWGAFRLIVMLEFTGYCALLAVEMKNEQCRFIPRRKLFRCY